MEPKTRIIRKRVKLKRRSFLKREVKWLDISYRDLSIFIVFFIVFLLGLFHKVIYNYIYLYWQWFANKG